MLTHFDYVLLKLQTIALLVFCRMVVGHKYHTSQLLTRGELKKFHRTPYVREFRGFEDTGTISSRKIHCNEFIVRHFELLTSSFELWFQLTIPLFSRRRVSKIFQIRFQQFRLRRDNVAYTFITFRIILSSPFTECDMSEITYFVPFFHVSIN